ncbi:hypothetical protein F441_11988 [Phytophthora nicotianae CJ01A1]|uniref:Uncharacterized protein n=6 Tax=Phytophthora nicotianae TaxID=4792 RepID=W2PZP1_PHYN3|nr:hypothetical protein PPTG_23355 [Phytophthora nicotianae INRA-310]ETI42928.1 hypothetical protein F443_12022 [Phytophthora nicotianae P1569]ETL36343.1 hypothetical protein L916_11660 [Phytophthora nicotianae]ETO71562.1 hypothetical protein F444_12117 [Phytophthora nicotianae P1976]ETP12625.1 hypothetical protein F441_11988 [Phytophthora nicotianae CJ01A1]ETP40783.1 hypothetical protein F442_11934 [Phytophthora nicotianae P10297]
MGGHVQLGMRQSKCFAEGNCKRVCTHLSTTPL